MAPLAARALGAAAAAAALMCVAAQDYPVPNAWPLQHTHTEGK